MIRHLTRPRAAAAAIAVLASSLAVTAAPALAQQAPTPKAPTPNATWSLQQTIRNGTPYTFKFTNTTKITSGTDFSPTPTDIKAKDEQTVGMSNGTWNQGPQAFTEYDVMKGDQKIDHVVVYSGIQCVTSEFGCIDYHRGEHITQTNPNVLNLNWHDNGGGTSDFHTYLELTAK
jgi:hypothetical protein